MGGVLRRHLVPLACFAAAGLVGIAAIIDHVNKGARMNRAEVAEWYCAHDGTRCGGPSSDAIERRWNERQLAYEIFVSTVGGGAVACSVLLEARRRRRRDSGSVGLVRGRLGAPRDP